jgi:hypothetical protein
MSDTPIYDLICAEQLFTPGLPAPPTSAIDWFADRTDPHATGLMPAVPTPTRRDAA